ncbi:MAG: hypothetical protein JWO63_623 [Frankiales bacterium]|jgi:uncharacterized protein (TIGR03086 family)|nr:hypothetical protein [Frankiales bacterium]
MIDLQPATDAVSTLVRGVTDAQLPARTPCTEASLGDLIDHLDGLAMAFALAARKQVPPGGSVAPSADGARLGSDWRSRIPPRLSELAQAWDDDSAWTGMTQVGGLELPGEAVGLIALDEILVHGWDIAVASGQSVRFESELVEAAYEFVRDSVAQNPQGTPGMFGPPVPTRPDAPLLDQLIGLTGRRPDWRAGSRLSATA